MATALLLGSDYRRILTGRSRLDFEIEQAVIVAALEQQRDREEANRKNLAVEIANALGPQITSAMSQTVQAVARAMR